MDRDSGLRALGLPPGAGREDVARIYKARSRPLKTLILCARSAEMKERHRDELRELIRCRDAALGREPPGDWRRRPIGVSGRKLLDRMSVTSVEVLDRGVARSFFQLQSDASDEEVREAYRLRSRALIRRFANALDESEMAAIRRARGKLRTIRNFALAEKEASNGQ